MNRREFLRSMVWCLGLTSCGKGPQGLLERLSLGRKHGPADFDRTESHPAIERDGLEIRIAPVISAGDAGDRNVHITCRFPTAQVAALHANPLNGLLLCAIECNSQAPYCCNALKGGVVPRGTNPTKDGSVQFFFSGDILSLLGLPPADKTYFVHASCMQYTSPVRVARIAA